ncbi:MAG TPA: YlbE-like family protein [Haloplasmataceae bacterium]
MTKTIMADLYKNNELLFYLRTHPEWYKVIHRYPESYKQFQKIAKEELKLTFSHKVDRFKNQVQLLSLINEYMKR